MLTMRTDIRISFPRPAQRRLDRLGKVHAVQPRLALVLEFAVFDLARELFRPHLRLMIRLPPDAAHPLLRDGAVPDMVEVQLAPLPQHVDSIPTPGHVFVVQGLMNVSDKVHHELGRLGPEPCRDGGVEDLRGVVLDRRYHAALLLAVAVELDGAVVWRLVLGVDEVEHARVVAPFRISDRVGPRSHVREIVGGVISEESLEVGRRLRLDKVASNICDRDMPEA